MRLLRFILMSVVLLTACTTSPQISVPDTPTPLITPSPAIVPVTPLPAESPLDDEDNEDGGVPVETYPT